MGDEGIISTIFWFGILDQPVVLNRDAAVPLGALKSSQGAADF